MHNYYYDIVCMQNYVIIPLVRFCDVLYIKLCIDHANIFINSSLENQKHTVGFPSFSFGLPPVRSVTGPNRSVYRSLTEWTGGWFEIWICSVIAGYRGLPIGKPLPEAGG
jgi:hypothetical protein